MFTRCGAEYRSIQQSFDFMEKKLVIHRLFRVLCTESVNNSPRTGCGVISAG